MPNLSWITPLHSKGGREKEELWIGVLILP